MPRFRQGFACFLVAVAVAVAAALSPNPAAAEEVRVYNWSDYIDETLLERFEQESGIQVVYDVFDSNEILEAKLLAGASGYDVVVPSHHFLARQISAGVFRKLDKSQLTNLPNAWELVLRRIERFDPGSAHSVNYMWGTTGFGYNVDKLRDILGPDAPLDSLSLMLDPAIVSKLAGCGVHMLDDPTETIPMALRYLGEDPASQDPAAIEKAEAALMAVRPYIAKFHSSEYINALANGEICLAHGYSGDVLQARDRAEEAGSNVEIAYAAPKEGAQMWFDQMAIPADAPNPAAAHKFIDFMLRPDVAAASSNATNYASGNAAARDLVDPQILNDPAVYPGAATLENLYTVSPYPPKTQRLVTRMWTRIKSGR